MDAAVSPAPGMAHRAPPHRPHAIQPVIIKRPSCSVPATRRGQLSYVGLGVQYPNPTGGCAAPPSSLAQAGWRLRGSDDRPDGAGVRAGDSLLTSSTPWVACRSLRRAARRSSFAARSPRRLATARRPLDDGAPVCEPPAVTRCLARRRAVAGVSSAGDRRPATGEPVRSASMSGTIRLVYPWPWTRSPVTGRASI